MGSRIPTESELSQLTGTSRNTVREAVQSLVHSGLLERRQGSGTYVVAASELSAVMGRQLAGAHVRHVLEVRRALEVGAAQLAATRRTDEDVQNQRRLIEQRNAATERGDTEEAVALDVQLHKAIVAAAHNPLLADLYEEFSDALHENIRDNLAFSQGQMSLAEHVALVDAITAGHADVAAQLAACDLDAIIELTYTTPGFDEKGPAAVVGTPEAN